MKKMLIFVLVVLGAVYAIDFFVDDINLLASSFSSKSIFVSDLGDLGVKPQFAKREEDNTITWDALFDVPEMVGAPELSIDFDGLKGQNPDFCGVLCIPCANVTEVMAQEPDFATEYEFMLSQMNGSQKKQYKKDPVAFLEKEEGNKMGLTQDIYSRHLFERTENGGYKKDKHGCIYADTDRGIDAPAMCVFGHNMSDGTMFAPVSKLVDRVDKVAENPYVYIYTEDVVLVYEIYAVNLTDKNDPAYRLNSEEYSEELMAEVTGSAVSTSLYAPAHEVEVGKTQNLTLFTCHGKNQRVIIHATLIGKQF